MNDLHDQNSSFDFNDIFFIPQKPYNFLGTLHEQIIYPKNIHDNQTINSLSNLITNHSKPLQNKSNEFFYDILRTVRLEKLCARVGQGNLDRGLNQVIVDWSKVLSLGEQQRLAFARVLYHQPRVVVLDGKNL